MELLSRTYGFTPRQIRNMADDEVQAYLAIINVRQKIADRRSKSA